MNSSLFQEEQRSLDAQIARARARVAALQNEARLADAELKTLNGQRDQYRLLAIVFDSLDKLEKSGGGHLFWGEQGGLADKKVFVARARSHSVAFNDQVAEVEKRKRALEGEIERELLEIDSFGEQIAQLQEREESKKSEFVIQREMSALPYRAMVMPWDPSGEDGKRFRKVIVIALLITVSLGTAMSLWKLPVEDRVVVEVPERLVKLVMNEPPPPPPQQPQPEEKEAGKEEEKEKVKEEEKKKEEEKVAEKAPEKAEVTAAEKKQARAKAQGSGVLAFKNDFADLMAPADEPKLGADAKLSVDVRKSEAGKPLRGLTQQRSLVVAQASGGSGGINTANLSRNVGGGAAGANITGVTFSRVQDAMATDAKEADRPVSNGSGPSRTDEELQIVFDRYKAALYRIYNRELRNDPMLRGKMVLRITVEPSGEVSACNIESNDLASAALGKEIVERVKKFNFGEKANVPRITIIYPIDFLPAT